MVCRHCTTLIQLDYSRNMSVIIMVGCCQWLLTVINLVMVAMAMINFNLWVVLVNLNCSIVTSDLVIVWSESPSIYIESSACENSPCMQELPFWCCGEKTPCNKYPHVADCPAVFLRFVYLHKEVSQCKRVELVDQQIFMYTLTQGRTSNRNTHTKSQKHTQTQETREAWKIRETYKQLSLQF